MTAFDLNEQELSSVGIKVKNIVGKLELGIEFDLSYLATELPNSTFEPERYPSLIFRPQGLPTVLVTRSGVLLFTGCDSTDSLLAVHQQVSNELEKIGVSDIKPVEDIKIVNIVSIFELKSDINLNKLSIELGLENIEYEPEQFPGLVYRIEDGPVVLIFASGNIVVTGATTTKDIVSAVETIRHLVSN